MPFGLVRSNRDRYSTQADGFPKNHLFVKKLQKGAEGQVQEWSNKRSHHLIAVKVMKRKQGLQPKELAFLAEIPENNFTIRFLAFFDKTPKPDECCIILEHCAVGDLYAFYYKHAKPKNNTVFSEAFMWSVFSQLANALAFLHEGRGCRNPSDATYWRPVIHRDIKLENILVTSMGPKDDFSTIKIKLGDFGMAAYYDPRTAHEQKYAGTPSYWAPEVTWEKRLRLPTPAVCSPATDVWAIGAVMHYFAHGLMPTECPMVTKQRWLDDKPSTIPWRRSWFQTAEGLWWPGMAKREVIPINLEPKHQPQDRRRQRPTPKYTDALNDHLMMALEMDGDERPRASKLARRIESAAADFVFEDLRNLHVQETRAAERRDTAMSPI